MEVFQGAQTLGMTVRAFLTELKAAGLGSLPGTAAEVLDDEVRRIICPDKVTTAQWLDIVETAHAVGLRTTATIMYGHVDHPRHWARHLLRLRTLQERTGGLTEFVPLPYVPMETPIYLRGRARSGPTYREAVLMHAVARLALHPHVTNIQTSWVKMGPDGVKACLNAGANDLGGTLDEREHHPGRRRRARRGDAARRDGSLDPLDRPQAGAAHHALWRRAGRAPRRLVQCRAAHDTDQSSGRRYERTRRRGGIGSSCRCRDYR